MRHSFTRTLLVFLVAVLGLPTTSRAQEGKKYKFVVITHATAVPFFVPVRKGAEDAGRFLGAEVVYTGPAGFDIQRQVEFMKSAIAQNVDGIRSSPSTPMRPSRSAWLTSAKATTRQAGRWDSRS
nr:RhaS: rhamnose ABC transporter, rhamnose-binding protein [uncultured bacterium]